MYLDFQNKMQKYLVFSINDIDKEFPKFDKKALVNWQKKEYIVKIRNGYYCFSHSNASEHFLYYCANKIYYPSYISMETALSYYNIIPEGVYTVTSITTLKTNSFNTSIGQFEYKHVKPKLYFGYKLLLFENKKVRMATLEKTVLDYIYLHTDLNHFDSYAALRWNKEVLTQLDFQLLDSYLLLYNSKALNIRITIFKNYINA